MNRIIYSKYSYNRDPKFQCRTIIKSNELDKKSVSKSSLNIVGEAHIASIFKNYKSLSEKYSGTKIELAKCIIVDNSTVQFDYIEGISLEILLDDFLEQKDYQSIMKSITEYFNELCKVDTLCAFQITSQFREVFGDVNFSKETICFENGNLDAIFSNVKLCDETYHFIDYEWCFPFPIPQKFILYRCLFWYINSQCREEKLHDMNLYKLFGFNDKELSIYKTMEDNYQKYVMGTQVPEWNIKSNLSTDTFILENHTKLLEKMSLEMQVYENNGSGFSEQRSFFMKSVTESVGTFDFHLESSSDIEALRIDPSINPCILLINQIFYTGFKIEKVTFEHNGYRLNDNIILFLEEDPKLVIKMEHREGLDFKGSVLSLDESSSAYFAEYVNTSNSEIKELSESLDDYRINVEGLTGHIDNLETGMVQLELEKDKLELEKDKLEEEVGVLNDNISQYYEDLKKTNEQLIKCNEDLLSANENLKKVNEMNMNITHKFYRIVKSRLFKLIAWKFSSDEIEL